MPSSLREGLLEKGHLEVSYLNDLTYIGSGLAQFATKTMAHIRRMDGAHSKDFREKLSLRIRRFHDEAETLITSIEEATNLVVSGNPLIRVAHQPNLFAALNILGLPVIASAVADI